MRWAYTGQGCAQCGGLPYDHGAGRGHRQASQQVWPAVCSPWRRDGLEWGSPGPRRRLHHRDVSHEQDSRHRLREPAGCGATWSGKSAPVAGRGRYWVLLCSRPFESGGVHDWRQCRRKLWWTAYVEVRGHHEPRPGSGGGPPRRCGGAPGRTHAGYPGL